MTMRKAEWHLNYANAIMILGLAMLSFKALASDVIFVNDTPFTLPDGWAIHSDLERQMRSYGGGERAIYNASTATDDNTVACYLKANDLRVDKNSLYGYRFNLTDWQQIFPNLTLSTRLQMIASSPARTARGDPLFIGTFSFEASETFIFQRVYVTYTGEKFISASCQGAAMTAREDAERMLQNNIAAVHLIGKNLGGY